MIECDEDRGSTPLASTFYGSGSGNGRASKTYLSGFDSHTACHFMTTEERRNIRRALIALGFRRTGVTDDPSVSSIYTETWKHISGEVIEVHYAKKTKRVLGSVVFGEKQTNDQVNWGSNDNPNDLLTVGTLYDVVEIEVHSWHTKIELAGFPGKKFNNVNFKWTDEKPLKDAMAAWPRA